MDLIQILNEIKDIKSCLHELNLRIIKLEVKDEERFRNEIKILASDGGSK